MVLFHVTYTALPGKAEPFLQAVREAGLLETIRQEDGCLGYDYYLSWEQPDQILLVERWRDGQAQKTHLAAPHMARLGELKGRYIEETRVWSCTAEA